MREIYILTKRNILNYIRDKASVFFSLLSVIILLFVYLLFLKNMFNDMEGLSNTQKNIFLLGYIMGGVLVVSTITLSLGVMGNYVSDLDTKKLNGILVAPISRYKITLAYCLSTAIVTTILTVLMFFLTFLYLGITVGAWYSFVRILHVLAVLILYVAISTPIMIFIISFVKSMNAFGAVSSIVGTLIGFISGIYIPLSALDPFTQNVAALMPFSHMTLYLRKILIGKDIINFIPDEALNAMGMSPVQLFGINVPMPLALLASVLVAALFFTFAYIKINKKQTS